MKTIKLLTSISIFILVVTSCQNEDDFIRDFNDVNQKELKSTVTAPPSVIFQLRDKKIPFYIKSARTGKYLTHYFGSFLNVDNLITEEPKNSTFALNWSRVWYVENYSSTPGLLKIKNERGKNNKFYLGFDGNSGFQSLNPLFIKEPMGIYDSWEFFKINGVESYRIRNSRAGFVFPNINNNKTDVYLTGGNPSVLKALNNIDDQQWVIEPVEEFELVDGMLIEYYVTADDIIQAEPLMQQTGFIRNNSSISQSYTVGFSRKASSSSTFARSHGITITASSEFKVGTVFVNEKLEVSTSISNSLQYSKSESSEDTRSYSFLLQVAPFRQAKAKMTVMTYRANISYKVKARGKFTGQIIYLAGQWDGVTLGDISYEIDEYNLDGTPTGRILNLKGEQKETVYFD